MTRLAALASAALLLQTAAPAQSTRFTARDMLNVVSVQVLDFSEHGRLVAVTLRRPADAPDPDNYRYGDPTYQAASAVQFAVIDTATGQRHWPAGEGRLDLRQAAFSRDASRLAYLVADAGRGSDPARHQLFVWSTAGGPATRVPVGGSLQIAGNSALDWSPDGLRVLVSMRSAERDRQAADRFRALTRGPIIVHSSAEPFLEWDDLNRANRWRTLAEIDVRTGAVTARVPERRITSFQVPRDHGFVVFQEDVTEKTDYDTIGGSDTRLAIASPGEADLRTLFTPKDFKGLTLRWSDDGRMMAYAKQGEVFVRGIGEAEGRSVTPRPKDTAPAPASGARPPAADAADAARQESFSPTSFSRDGAALLVTSAKGWYVVNVADGARRQILTIDEKDETAPRLAPLGWTPDGAGVYATWSARDRWERGVVRIDTRGGQVTPLVRDARLYSGVQVSRDGRRILVSISDGDRPADLYATDPTFSQFTRLTDLNPWLASYELPKSELVKYRDSDGKELYGVLRYPTGYVKGRTYPTVFEIYETFFDNGFNARAAFLTNHGYAVFHPSVNLVVGRPGEAWLKGVTAAANKLIDMGVADPKRLGVHGTSYGGYATVLLLTQTDRFKAAINVSGKVDMVSFYTDSPRLGVRNTHAPEKSQDRIGGTLWEYPERYLEHSAVLNADRITTPLLNITGDQDPNVPASQSREIYYALRRLGKPVEWVRYVNGAHRPPSTAAESVDFENRILAWYDKYLKADEKPVVAGGASGGRGGQPD